MHATRFLLAASLLPLAAPVARAQQPAADTAQLHPVVVTATRVSVSQAASVASTTVITGSELRARGITTVQDALRDVPGIDVPRTGSFGGQTSLYVRGGQGDYTQVLVDGVPVNDPGGFIDLANLTTDDVERIEVVRGPASVLYGANAVTGVIQIFTRRGSGPLRASLAAGGGSYGAREVRGAMGAGSDRAGFALAAAHHGTDGIYAFNSAARNNVFDASARVAPDARTALRASARYIDAAAHIATDFTGAVIDSNQFHTERRWIGSVEGSRRFGDRLEARVLLGATNGATRDADLPDSPGDPCFCYDAPKTTYRRSVDARLSWSLSPDIVLSGGAVAERQRQHAGSDAPLSRDLRAYYAQGVGTVRDVLSWVVGARVDDNSAFGTFGTWRAAAAWRVAPGTSVRASVGTAFKEPTFDQVSSTSPFARGNPDLRPERARSWDAGVEQRVARGALTLAATYFHQRFRDMIQYDAAPSDSVAQRYPPDAVPNYFNVAAALADGVELEARVSPSPRWSATASYTRLRTTVVDAGVDGGPTAPLVTGAPLLRRPAHAASLALAVRPADRVRLHADASYVGRRADANFADGTRVEDPAYTLVALAAELDVLRRAAGVPSLTLTARLDNALDERYDAIFGFRSPGRMLLAGARLEW